MKVGRISSLGEASDLPVRPAVSRLFESISSFEALNNAWVQSRKHKRYSASATEFAWNAEKNLLKLRDELQCGSYVPGEYRLFSIREPKPRIIAAAPFRDRVVHHALVSALTPKFEPSFSFDSYATRVGKGTHAALLRFHQYFRRYQFVLKCDIAKFFPSMDHQVLKSILRRKVTCRQTLRLIDQIIDHSPEATDRYIDYYPGDDLFTFLERPTGLPIGNLTSQFFANVFLDPLDHFVKESLRVKGYLRYMDDFCLFANDKQTLWQQLQQVEQFLTAQRLSLRRPKTRLYSTAENVEFLGYRILRTHRRVVTSTARRMQGRLRQKFVLVVNRQTEPAVFRQNLCSCLGHLSWAQTKGLADRIGRHGGWAPPT